MLHSSTSTPTLSRIAALALLPALMLPALALPSWAADEGLPFSPALPPPMGRIAITTGADPAEIYVDGENAGTTPLTITVDSGERVIVLKKDGFADFEQRLNVIPLETQTLQAEMVRR